jgi:dihydroorotase
MTNKTLRGRFVFPRGVRSAIVSFDTETGVIRSVKETGDDRDKDPLIFPGFIDLHVHAREYPMPAGDDARDMEAWEAACRKETFSTAGRAAVNGGVTLFGAMPNDPAPPRDLDSYELKKIVAEQATCPVVCFAAITPEQCEPWGDLPYKVYLDARPSATAFDRWSILEETLARFSGRRVFFHAEDPEVLRAAGKDGPRWKTRPPAAEIRAVERILEFTARFGLSTHICHVSTRDAVRLINEFNARGSQRVTCEVTPHHLFFSVDGGAIVPAAKCDMPDPRFIECNPPVRSEDDRAYLVDALQRGEIDVLATDHAPHTVDDKGGGAPGMPHLDTLGPFAAWLMLDCGFSSVRVAEILSAVPAEILSPDIATARGVIEPGKAASFTVIDTSASTRVGTGEILGRGPLQTRCGWSPFAGATFPGSVTAVVVSGREYSFR